MKRIYIVAVIVIVILLLFRISSSILTKENAIESQGFVDINDFDFLSLTIEDFEEGFARQGDHNLDDILVVEIKEVTENTKRDKTNNLMGITYEFIFSNLLDDEMNYFVKVFFDEEIDNKLYISSSSIGTTSGPIDIPNNKRYIMSAECLIKDYEGMTTKEKAIYDDKIGDFKIIMVVNGKDYYLKISDYKIVN